ncbi:MAG: hypothetical protein Q4A41_03710 [Bacillota bacterium]|nr:hypothetical protein [Bacillota bacterium]
MDIDKYIEKLRLFLSLSFRAEDVSDITSEYRTYLEEDLKNGCDEDEMIRRYGSPRVLAKKLRKENGMFLFKLGFIVRMAVLCITCVFGVLFWGYLAESILSFAAYLIMSIAAVRFAMGGSVRKRKNTSERYVKNRLFLTSHFVLLASALVAVFININIVTLIGKGFDVSSQVYLVYYGSMLVYIIAWLQSLFCFLTGNGIYFSLTCHAMGGIFMTLFMYNRYYNMDYTNIPYRTVFQSSALYLIGALLSVAIYLSYAEKRIGKTG